MRQFYLLSSRPYESAAQNNLAIYNEMLVSLCLYCYITMTDFNESQQIKVDASYGLLGITALYIVTNLGYFLFMAFKLFGRYLKKTIALYNHRKA